MIDMWEQLTYLGEAYFHQDFDLEDPTPIDSVRRFMDSATADEVSSLRSEVLEVVSDHLSEHQLKHLWLQVARSSYDPARDGLSYQEWFGQMSRVLSE